MKDSIKFVDITIQKKFKELLDAKREGRSYNFRNELKKELEIILQELKDNNPMEMIEVENLLHEMDKQRVNNIYTQ